jgi:hypothetical protein
MMHLVQVLLPVYDNQGQHLAAELHHAVRDELAERFGGLTAYTRAPAEGLWKESAAQTSRDDIVVYEVMTAKLDADWWSNYRRDLEGRFRQQQVIVRAQSMRLL